MKIILKGWIAICILFATHEAYTQNTPGSLTLRQSVDVAIANNLLVRQTDILKQNADINLKQARSNRLPDLFGNLNHGINQGRSIDPFTNTYINQKIFYGNYSLGTNVTLFNGLQLKNIVKQNSLIYEASKLELQQSKDELTLNVLLSYLLILNNEDQLQQSMNQVVVSKKQVERLETLNKEGAIIPAQYYELKGQLANDEL
ncbi:MAG TPA: TolC family protein, partial [Ferruginibacter sp.]|nr:TolC family protein [Ferruginibacter sp.]